jgi:prevent-host-death family protein
MLEVNLAEDVFPISQAQDSLRRVVQKATDTRRPMVITQNGRPVVAIVEIAEFERVRRLAELAEDYRAIIAGLEGPSLSHEEVWQEMEARIKAAGVE